MKLTAVQKTKIIGLIRTHGQDDMYIADYLTILKSKRLQIELIEFLISYLETCFLEKKEMTNNFIIKLQQQIFGLICWKEELSELAEFNQNLLNRLFRLKDKYKSYTDNPDTIITANFAEIDELKEKFNYIETFEEPVEASSLQEMPPVASSQDFENQIKELTDKVEALEKSLTKAKNDLNKAQKNSAELQQEKERINKEYIELQDIYRQIRRLIHEFHEELSKRDTIPSKYITIKNTINNELTAIADLLANYKELLDDYLILSREKEMYLKEKKVLAEEEMLKSMIIDRLGKRAYTLGELLSSMQNETFEMNFDRLYNLLIEIGKSLTITFPNPSLPVKYQIQPPEILRNRELPLEIPSNKDTYSIMIISDLHANVNYFGQFKTLEALRNYIKKNRINLVADLGDILDERELPSDINSYSIEKVKKTIADISHRIPDFGVPYILLGGNHEEQILKYGLDPLKVFSELRRDFIPLGYEHAYLRFNEHQIIGLHHARMPSLSYPFKMQDYYKINRRLEEIYREETALKKQRYFDFLGHLHIGSVNSGQAWATVSSLFQDKQAPGAYNLIVHFNSANEIESLTIIPLIFEHELYKAPEIIYKKTLKNN